MKRLPIAIAVLVVTAFTVLGVASAHNFTKENRKLKIDSVQLKSLSEEKQKLEVRYEQLDAQLKEEAKQNTVDVEKAKELEAVKKQLEEKTRLLEARKAEKSRLAKLVGTKTASAQAAPKQAPGGSCADWMRQAGIPETAATTKLILKESGCNPRAQNPTTSAYGIGQFLDSTWGLKGVNCVKTSDPVQQLICMDRYVKVIYGTWENALAKWYSRCGSGSGCWY